MAGANQCGFPFEGLSVKTV